MEQFEAFSSDALSRVAVETAFKCLPPSSFAARLSHCACVCLVDNCLKLQLVCSVLGYLYLMMASLANV